MLRLIVEDRVRENGGSYRTFDLEHPDLEAFLTTAVPGATRSFVGIEVRMKDATAKKEPTIAERLAEMRKRNEEREKEAKAKREREREKQGKQQHEAKRRFPRLMAMLNGGRK